MWERAWLLKFVLAWLSNIMFKRCSDQQRRPCWNTKIRWTAVCFNWWSKIKHGPSQTDACAAVLLRLVRSLFSLKHLMKKFPQRFWLGILDLITTSGLQFLISEYFIFQSQTGWYPPVASRRMDCFSRPRFHHKGKLFDMRSSELQQRNFALCKCAGVKCQLELSSHASLSGAQHYFQELVVVTDTSDLWSKRWGSTNHLIKR